MSKPNIPRTIGEIAPLAHEKLEELLELLNEANSAEGKIDFGLTQDTLTGRWSVVKFDVWTKVRGN